VAFGIAVLFPESRVHGQDIDAPHALRCLGRELAGIARIEQARFIG